jgi:hypothetical protein
MKLPTRLASVLAALSLSLLLAGCETARLHILVPDFFPSGVDGLRLYRVLDGGALKGAGQIVFSGLTKTAQGLQVQYTQYATNGKAWGPLTAQLLRPATGQAELQLTIINPNAGGYFRFASYNEHGTSRPSTGQLYLATTQP